LLIELGEVDGASLARIAAPRRSAPREKAIALRLGWLLETHRPDVKLDALRIVPRPVQGTATLLSASGPERGSACTCPERIATRTPSSPSCIAAGPCTAPHAA